MSCLIPLTTVLLLLLLLSTTAFAVPVNSDVEAVESCPICPPLELQTSKSEVPELFPNRQWNFACGSIKPMDSSCTSEVSCFGTYESVNSNANVCAQPDKVGWWCYDGRGTQSYIKKYICTSMGWIDENFPENPLTSTKIVCLADLPPNTNIHNCPIEQTTTPLPAPTTTPPRTAPTTTTPPTALTTTTRPSTNYCREGWTFFDGTKSCYKTINNCTFDNCEKQCQNLGAHLASIHSADENKFVNDFAASGIPQWNFNQTTIGVHKIGNKWVWTDGTPFDYKNWAVGQPDFNLGKQWCGITYADIPSHNLWNLVHYSWDDVECNIPIRAAVCKMPALQ